MGSNTESTLNWKGILFELFDKDGREHPIFETELTSSPLSGIASSCFFTRIIWVDISSGNQVEVIGLPAPNKRAAERNAAHIAVGKVFDYAVRFLDTLTLPSSVLPAIDSESCSSYQLYLPSIFKADGAHMALFHNSVSCNSLLTPLRGPDKFLIETMVLCHFLAKFPARKTAILVSKACLVDQRMQEISSIAINLR